MQDMEFADASEETRYKQALVEESDMRLTEEMFGAGSSSSSGGSANAAAAANALPRLELVKCETHAEFQRFAQRLGDKINEFSVRVTHTTHMHSHSTHCALNGYRIEKQALYSLPQQSHPTHHKE